MISYFTSALILVVSNPLDYIDEQTIDKISAHTQCSATC